MNILLVNCSIMIVINVIFFFLFERSKPSSEELLTIVVICCAASLGRVIFAIIPQVQPVTALVIVTGCVFGCQRGYITGALCALISNLMLGQGPWTLFQMVGWGTVGLLAGLLGKITNKCGDSIRMIVFVVYGFCSAFLFSFITDLLSISYLGNALIFSSAISVVLAGFAFSIGHALGNVLMILFMFDLMRRKLLRIKKKQGIKQI